MERAAIQSGHDVVSAGNCWKAGTECTIIYPGLFGQPIYVGRIHRRGSVSPYEIVSHGVDHYEDDVQSRYPLLTRTTYLRLAASRP